MQKHLFLIDVLVLLLSFSSNSALASTQAEGISQELRLQKTAITDFALRAEHASSVEERVALLNKERPLLYIHAQKLLEEIETAGLSDSLIHDEATQALQALSELCLKVFPCSSTVMH